MSARLVLSEGDLNTFFRVPFEAYPDRMPYVSPMRRDLRSMLDGDRNPFFHGHGEGTVFTVTRARRAVGRVSAHIHHDSNRRYGTSRGSFGFLDLVDDADVARLLLGAAESWLRRRGCTEVCGNFDLTSVQEMGVVTDGHDNAPYTAMKWSPPHLPRLLRGMGYEPFFPMTTFEADLRLIEPDDLLGPKQCELLRDDRLTLGRLDRQVFERRGEDVRRILNEGFADNPHFVPASREEFDFQCGPLTRIVDGRTSVLADHDGAPVGVAVCIPDMNPLLQRIRSRIGPTAPWHLWRHMRSRRRATLLFASATPDFQTSGLGTLMLARVVRALRHAGYTHLGITWVSDGNAASLRMAEKLGASPLHRLSLFRRSLED